MEKVKINVINKSSNALPKYASVGSAGVDLRANITEKIILKSLERIAVPTGLYIELPEGFEHYADLVKGAGDYLVDNISSISYKSYSIDKYINPSSFTKLGKNQIIMFEGHGSFTQISEQDPLLYSVM